MVDNKYKTEHCTHVVTDTLQYNMKLAADSLKSDANARIAYLCITISLKALEFAFFC